MFYVPDPLKAYALHFTVCRSRLSDQCALIPPPDPLAKILYPPAVVCGVHVCESVSLG